MIRSKQIEYISKTHYRQDLKAYPNSPIKSQDQDVKRECCTSRCTDKVDDYSQYARLSGKSVLLLQLRMNFYDLYI